MNSAIWVHFLLWNLIMMRCLCYAMFEAVKYVSLCYWLTWYNLIKLYGVSLNYTFQKGVYSKKEAARISFPVSIALSFSCVENDFMIVSIHQLIKVVLSAGAVYGTYDAIRSKVIFRFLLVTVSRSIRSISSLITSYYHVFRCWTLWCDLYSSEFVYFSDEVYFNHSTFRDDNLVIPSSPKQVMLKSHIHVFIWDSILRDTCYQSL